MTHNVKTIRLEMVVLLNALVVAFVYLMPTISHLTSVPLYKFEPMRFVLLLNLLVTGSKKNAYILAVSLPLFSFLVGGHPVLIKAFLMAVELTMNVFLFDRLSLLLKNSALVMFLSIIASKAIYYVAKIVIMEFGLLSGPLFATSLLPQLISVIIIAALFWRYDGKKVIN